MLKLRCPNCGVEGEETEFAAGGEAHLQRFAAGSGEAGPLASSFWMERFREGRFIDESVAAGVAH